MSRVEQVITGGIVTGIYGGAGYGAGLVVSKITSCSPLLAPVLAVTLAVDVTIAQIVNAIGKRGNFHKHNITLIKSISSLVVATVAIALGILGVATPVGVAIGCGAALGFFVKDLYNASKQYRTYKILNREILA